MSKRIRQYTYWIFSLAVVVFLNHCTEKSTADLCYHPGISCSPLAGTLDTQTFQNGTYSNAVGSLIGVGFQSDGKIIVVGSQASNSAILFRFTKDGVLDTSFGTGGTTIFDDSGALDVDARTMTIQSNDKILIGGTWQGGNSFVARFSVDGTFESDQGSCGNPGSVVITFLARQANGKIIVAGNNSKLTLAHADCSLDASFSVTDTVFSVASAAAQADGKILASGSSGGNFILNRYLTDGSVDGTFSGGSVTTDFGAADSALSLAIQTDGKILLGGTSGGNNFALARYASDGSLDATFNGGKVMTNISGGADHGKSIAIQSDGKIIMGGTVNAGSKTGLIRFNSDGSLDASFGTGGKAIFDYTSTGVAVAIQPSGKIISSTGLTTSGISLFRVWP